MSELTNNIVSSLVNFASTTNESSFSAYDYLYDTTDNNNNNISYSNNSGSQHLAEILHQLFSKMSDNQTGYQTQPDSSLSKSSSSSLFPTSLFSFETFLPASSSDTNSYRILAIISLWFVLIVNPIVILFGVTGNLLATYILIHCNIVKLPVSFYTIMLNISDTLNLLIPVFIFWLDNCFNRIPERGYFRDKSNFLCKALMCPDQLFVALSAWYMCAISFNRWYSVCRPSSYFFSTTNIFARTSGAISNQVTENNGVQKKGSSTSIKSSVSSLKPFCFPLNCCYYLTLNTKYRQHLQAFRSIVFITFMGILCCLYPVFMHELRAVISTNEHIFDLKHETTHTYAIIWKRCYYSRKHEYAYDIIGMILSCLLHILPLTFVAAMNIMIILRLKQRQRLMSVSTSLLPSQIIGNTKRKSYDNCFKKRISCAYNCPIQKKEKHVERIRTTSQPTKITTHKDQATITDLSLQTPRLSTQQLTIPNNLRTMPKRHYSRDRTITIMLVSVALSYLLLTLPYRLFWSYNVYIKRMHPEKLSSSTYLLRMHYIDHVLRTIRNIHYGSNFVFFIFLSKTFRRKFRQLFIEKFFRTTNRLFNRNSDLTSTKNSRNNHQRRLNSKLEKKGIKRNTKFIDDAQIITNGYLSKSLFDETPSLIGNVNMQREEIVPIIELEHINLSRYDGE